MIAPPDFALAWVGKRRERLTGDYEQAMVLTGACYENSGINAADTLGNENFRPHPALPALLDWFQKHSLDAPWRNAAIRASVLVKGWRASNKQKAEQTDLFFGEEG